MSLPAAFDRAVKSGCEVDVQDGFDGVFGETDSVGHLGLNLDEMLERDWLSALFIRLFKTIVDLAEGGDMDNAHRLHCVANCVVEFLDVWFAVMLNQFAEGWVIEQDRQPTWGEASTLVDLLDRHARSKHHRDGMMRMPKTLDDRVKLRHLPRTSIWGELPVAWDRAGA